MNIGELMPKLSLEEYGVGMNKLGEILMEIRSHLA
jgi:predicted NAD-dependent protein-ADP-ribosyltransferase YbiA (DUF1768 family)